MLVIRLPPALELLQPQETPNPRSFELSSILRSRNMYIIGSNLGPSGYDHGSVYSGLRRKYPPHEYVSMLLLVVGLILFTLADANTSLNFSILGVVMVSGALIMDSFLENFQEVIFTMNPNTTQVI
ncbi:hypothetical protein L1987_20417 [Smallanthus sonchifolius]|uniref:Uncharacterized protein n=1 Tax=Smallanthus sonchifolius TaxID=185202 RepID=A0ACB9IS07_9ASTR|nr:hypothetical protein L1987_20417 [Smallanthus sonchifolius]